MSVRIRFTRDSNIHIYDTDETELDLETYVWGVVASEIGNAALEACRALAVAARTNAVGAMRAYGSVTDTSPQAYRADRLTEAYSRARQGAVDTAGEVLVTGENKIAYPAAYSANNGGRTRSSKER